MTPLLSVTMTRATTFAIGWLLYAVALPVHAATITVTNTNDSGPGSLRQALTIANDGETITFAVTGTIRLTSGGLVIDKNITIQVPARTDSQLTGTKQCIVFGVFPSKTVTISGLTIRNAEAGAGVWNEQGTLTVSDCAVTSNSYQGLYNHEGTLNVNNCVLSGNSGAGLSNYGVAAVVLCAYRKLIRRTLQLRGRNNCQQLRR